jgi:hypothetical protein
VAGEAGGGGVNLTPLHLALLRQNKLMVHMLLLHTNTAVRVRADCSRLGSRGEHRGAGDLLFPPLAGRSRSSSRPRAGGEAPARSFAHTTRGSRKEAELSFRTPIEIRVWF